MWEGTIEFQKIKNLKTVIQQFRDSGRVVFLEILNIAETQDLGYVY